MTSIRIRPRFQQIVPASPDVVQERLRTQLAQSEVPCTGSMLPGHVVLKVLAREQHYWSPQLSLTLEPHEQGTLVRGLYGPNPTVWAMFAMGYGAISILALFIGIIGLSARSLGQPAPILWALPILFLAALILYLIAQVGQKLGAEQTFLLHHFYENTIGERVPVH